MLRASQTKMAIPAIEGLRGMTSIPKHIAKGLDVRTGEVVGVEDGDSGWEVVCESGLLVTGDALVLGTPVPQALDLTSSGSYTLPDGARRQLEAVSYDPCLALMVLLDDSTGVPEPGGMQIKSEPVDWISDNRRKGISRPLPSLSTPDQNGAARTSRPTRWRLQST